MTGVPVVWVGRVLRGSTPEDFEKWFKEELGYNVEYLTEFKMEDGTYKGLNCILFNVMENIGKFCIFRLGTVDMKWLEDIIDNERLGVPSNIIKEYGGI